MNRRGFGISLTLGAALLLAGCADSGDPAAEVRQLTVQIDQLQEQRKAFEAQVERERAGKPVQQKAPPRSVKIVRMFPIPLTDELTLPGSVEPWQEVELSTRLAGIVDQILLDEGATAQQGQPLFLLDAAQYQAACARAQAQLTHNEKQYQRQKELQESNVSSKEVFDLSEMNYNTSRAEFEQAKINLAWTKITAPIAGTLDRRLVELGEYVSPGDVLGKIVQLDRVKVLVNIPEKDVLYFNTGDAVRVLNEHPGAKEQAVTGVIEFLALTADPVTRTFPAKVAVQNPHGDFRPGMIVRAKLTRRKNAQALAVPFFAIVDREDGKGVFVERDGVAREIQVETGIIRGGLIEIVSGLNPGDHLVVVGQRELVDGEAVAIAEDITPLAQSMLNSGQDLAQLVMKIY